MKWRDEGGSRAIWNGCRGREGLDHVGLEESYIARIVCPCESFFREWMIGFHDLPFLLLVCSSRSSGRQSRSSTISTKWMRRGWPYYNKLQKLSFFPWWNGGNLPRIHNSSIRALLKPMGCRLTSPIPALCGPPPALFSSLYLCLWALCWLPSASSPPSWGSNFFLPPIVPFLFHIHCLAISLTPPTSDPQRYISCHLTTTVAKPALDIFNATSSPSNLHFLDLWATLKMEGASCSERLVTNNHQHVSISQKTKRQNVIHKKWRTWA